MKGRKSITSKQKRQRTYNTQPAIVVNGLSVPARDGKIVGLERKQRHAQDGMTIAANERTSTRAHLFILLSLHVIILHS